MQGHIQVVSIFIFALLLRWCVTYHSHSGQEKPPMFGDYEAQRHWQEITLNLPIDKWYINTTDNDLQYWGLDYPPLTAYHSLLLGYIANRTDPSYTKLYSSRGISSEAHKYFMRLTVFIGDALIYLPSMIYFVFQQRISKSVQLVEHNIFGFTKAHLVLLTMLIYPGIILIDHGHFQYNNISLGLFVASVAAVLKNSFIPGSIFFVLALNYKQMELYHALPFFFYILGSQLSKKDKSWISAVYNLMVVSRTVIFTFAIVWAPFLQNWNLVTSVAHRLFPFSRGLFEDKVANVWCAINVIIKLRNVFTNVQLAQICLIVTIIAVLPSCINLYLVPTQTKFVISLINCALAFFLFSFQVHEKTILLVAVPVILYFHLDPLPCFWFLLISHFSMLPLFIKDNLQLAYFATLVFYFVSVLWMWQGIIGGEKHKSGKSLKAQKGSHFPQEKNKENVHSKIKTSAEKPGRQTVLKSKFAFVLQNVNFVSLQIIVFYLSMAGMVFLSLCSMFLKPPQKYPDLYPLLVSVYSCAHFCIFYLYFNYKQLSLKPTDKKPKMH